MIKDTVLLSRSYRSFDEKREISTEKLRDLIDTARKCPSAMNRQPLKYKIVNDKGEREELLKLTKWGGSLPDLKLPPDGHHPVAFIIVCCDLSICDNIDSARFDAGAASQTILLSACEDGLGGCILGAFDKQAVADLTGLGDQLKPIVIIALGKPAEKAIICSVPRSGNISYFRDSSGTHFVPKRSIEEIIV